MQRSQRQSRTVTPSQTSNLLSRNTVHSRTQTTFVPIRCHSPSFRCYVGSRADGTGFSRIPSSRSSCSSTQASNALSQSSSASSQSSSSSSQSSSPPTSTSKEQSPTPFSSPPELSDRLQTTTSSLPTSSAAGILNAFSVPTLQVIIPTPPPSPPTSNAQFSDGGESLYIGAHFAEHCTVGCLAHDLSCGHKVYTADVEPCADNCNRPSSPSSSIRRSPGNIPNPRTDKEAFVCPVCVDSFINNGFHSFKVDLKSRVTRIEGYEWGPLPFGGIQKSIPLHLLMDEHQFRKRIQELGRRCDAVLNEHSGLEVDCARPTATEGESAEHQKPEVVGRKGRPPVFVRRTPALDQVIEQLRSVEVEGEKV